MKKERIASSIDSITDKAIESSAAKYIPLGSLLMVVRGMILAHSFPVAINTVPVAINQDMKALVFSNMDEGFLLLMMQGLKNEFVSLVDRSSHGTCKLVSEKLWSKVLAIPPLKEQHLIAEQVNELLTLCEQLKNNINKAQTTQLNLTDAIFDSSI